MGNAQSLPYLQQVAAQSFDAAQLHFREHHLPKPTGAIPAYIDGRCEVKECIARATALEVNEFKKLAPAEYAKWYVKNREAFKCHSNDPTACYGANNHLEGCPLNRAANPLPTQIRVQDDLITMEIGRADRRSKSRGGSRSRSPRPRYPSPHMQGIDQVVHHHHHHGAYLEVPQPMTTCSGYYTAPIEYEYAPVVLSGSPVSYHHGPMYQLHYH